MASLVGFYHPAFDLVDAPAWRARLVTVIWMLLSTRRFSLSQKM
jgi:hypothetical protein